MKTAIFPGSFNPWHEGHQDILDQALKVFDKVIVAQGMNRKKDPPEGLCLKQDRVEVIFYHGLLVDILKKYRADVVIKGLRNTTDFEYEKIQQYWNEDLGIQIPTYYIISNRNLVHISSSAIRLVGKNE